MTKLNEYKYTALELIEKLKNDIIEENKKIHHSHLTIAVLVERVCDLEALEAGKIYWK